MLTNYNTKERFNSLNKKEAEAIATQQFNDAIEKGEWKKDLTLLNRFHLFTYADIKSYKYTGCMMLPYHAFKSFHIDENKPISEHKEYADLNSKIREFENLKETTYFYAYSKDGALTLSTNIEDALPYSKEGITLGYLDSSLNGIANPMLLNYLYAFSLFGLKVNSIIAIKDMIISKSDAPFALKNSKMIKLTYEFEKNLTLWQTNAKKEIEFINVDLKALLDPNMYINNQVKRRSS